MRVVVLLLLAAALVAVVLAGEDEPLPLARDVRTRRFMTAVVCATCHSNSDDTGAMRDSRGRGVAPHDLWQGTMMANAARDPFFRAALAAEAAAFPERREEIEARCLRCHAPMASVEAVHAGRRGLAFADLDNNEDHAADDRAALARDSVSCTVCHQIEPQNLGQEASFSGGFVIGEERLIYGPHGDQWGHPMKRMVQYWPEKGEHMLRAELCATCHTDVRGKFHEQATYLEWKESAFAREGKTCQACHLPTTSEGGTPIRTRIARSHRGDMEQLKAHAPIGRHLFVGGNTLVPALLRDHARELHVRAPAAAFDATIARAKEQLEERTATLLIAEATAGVDVLTIVVKIENLAGHKFPTGHASRRAWLRLRVRDADGNVIFRSGEFDEHGRIVGPDQKPLPFEAAGGPIAPPLEQVSAPGEVHLFEAVRADEKGNAVFSPLRAKGWRKDTRLPPRGSKADADADGATQRTYEVPVDRDLATFSVEVALLYQPLSTRYAAELFVTDHPEVRRFRRMVEAADRRPVTVARARATYRPE